MISGGGGMTRHTSSGGGGMTRHTSSGGGGMTHHTATQFRAGALKVFKEGERE